MYPSLKIEKKFITFKTLVKQSFLEVSVNKNFLIKHTCAIYTPPHLITQDLICFFLFNILITFQNVL